MTNFEITDTQYNRFIYSYNVVKGFFEAPVDGKYEFMMAHDDGAFVYMSLDDSQFIVEEASVTEEETGT